MILLSSSIRILIKIRTNQTESESESVQLKQNPNRNLDKSIGNLESHGNLDNQCVTLLQHGLYRCIKLVVLYKFVILPVATHGQYAS